MNAKLNHKVLLPTAQAAALAIHSQRQLAAYLSPDIDVQKIQVIDQYQQTHAIELPMPALRMFLDILAELAQGNAVKIVPIHAELTTQQAAELLNVSRPYVVKLLEQGLIPYHKVGKHRRVRYADLIIYQQQQRSTSEQAMYELMEQAQDLGMGYE